MKICFKLPLLFLSQFLAINLNIFIVTMGVLNIQSTFSYYGVHGKCIHDNLDWNMQKINPQIYDKRLIQLKKNPIPSTTAKTTTQVTAKLKTTNPLLTTSQQYLFPNHRISRNEEMVISTSNIKRTTRQINSETDYSNLENDDISVVTNNDIIYVDESENSDLYENIRIKVWYDYERISFNNDSVEFSRLKKGLDRAIEKMENLLSVIPVQGSLLLSRHDICQGIWLDPNLPNFGRCGQIDQSYNGESCLDNFKIPDDHLAGFEVFNRNNSDPTVVHYSNGTGIPHTDTVIYVRSDSTSRCADGDTVAYAKFCQLDQFNRPLAGFANFCPNHLLNENYNEEKFYLIVLHELFHVLGFSNSLFDKFQQCTNQPVDQITTNLLPGQEYMRVCEQRSNVVDLVKDWYRVLSPAVSRESNEHFNCSDIKGPLEGIDEQPKITSHWESRFMQPSLMTASIGLPHLTVLDRITLALFEDSGWYKVDYSKADHLFWGKNAGCEFGTKTYCTSTKSPFFCTAANVVNGCHYLHLDKGVCKTTDFLDSCKIYQPNKDSGCWGQPDITESDEVLTGEVYNINSRCFISNLSAEATTTTSPHRVSKRSLKEEGRCYEHRCNTTNTLEIRVRGSEWIVCPQNTYRKVPGYEGSIRCPSSRMICSAEFSGQKFAKAVSDLCAMVNVSFKDLQKFLTSPLQRNETRDARYKEFVKKLVETINNLVGGNGSEVVNQHMLLRGETIGFNIRTNSPPGGDGQQDQCSEAVRRLRVAVRENIFSVVVGGVELMANQINVKYNLKMCRPSSHDDDNDITDTVKTPPKTPPGGVVGAITVGAVCTLVFASVGGILYWKNTIPRSIAPTVSSVEVAYQHTARASPAYTSECGSVGQIEFPV